MHVEMRPITSIHPYDHNPRHNDPAVDAVAASIREFGFRQPIVVDEQDIIIVGHTRYRAALKLGLACAECSRLIDHEDVEGLMRRAVAYHQSPKN
ncbi:MAG TPA: ParB N-terminal domain-containing protein [Gemmataceae bacterium]|jgi:ParB-like chromosome segregation protein Spo0J